MSRKKLSGEVYYPSQEVLQYTSVKEYESLYEEAKRDYPGFWAKEAEEFVWFEKWDKVIDDDQKPFYKWFVNGKTNIVYNCLDRHIKTPRKNKLALIWEGENGDFRALSYFAMCREVKSLQIF